MKTRNEIENAFRAKYEALKPSFPQIGPFESHRMSRLGDIRVCDLGENGRAAFVMDGDGNIVEVHGGIYDVWKGNGGANGALGLPVADESDYHDPDARPGDRFSRFENGVIVWRADTWKTEVHIDQAEHQGAGACIRKDQTTTRKIKTDEVTEAKKIMIVQQIPDYKPGVRVRGVNLGGWLVLERWMKESLFAGVNGKDETCFCVQLGREEATRRLREHWDTWITEADFAWIADHGFNAVRIPVGHWIFGSASGYPYHERYGSDPHPYVDGGIERLDRAFDWAEKHGLMILVDLHCAPGCQNGFDNGGLEGVCDWYKKPEYVDFTVLTLERLAERYGKRKALWGIETLNEPNWEVPDWVLGDFNWRAYQAIRKHCPPENGAVVIHDGFRDSRIKDVFGGKMPHPEFQNVVLDTHRYQCFGPGPGQPDLRTFDHAANIRHAEGHIADEMRTLNETVYWTVCGEWSLATGGRRNDDERQEFFDAQAKAFGNCQGFFFWSYKLENGDPSWSLRDAVERGLTV